MSETWYVYIIKCKDDKLYVGVAQDVAKRVNLHDKGLACRFTKYRHPVMLLYKERQSNYSCARTREKEIKGFSRDKKLALARRDPSAYRPQDRKISSKFSDPIV